MKMMPYHYIGYYNPVPKMVTVNFEKLEKEILDSYLNYNEIIEELWKVPKQKENQMKRHDFRIAENGEIGWYISPVEKIDGEYYYLWKDLELHRADTGFTESGYLERGKAPGYYPSREIAENYLRIYLRHFKKEKCNMADQIEITVKVNGVATPLHEISEQTLLTARENSKPKEVPIARTADTPYGNRRLVLKVPKNINVFAKSEFIVIDLKYGSIQNNYEYGETRKLEDYYKNLQVIS